MHAKAKWIAVLVVALALVLVSISLAQPGEGPASTGAAPGAGAQGVIDDGAIESVGVIVNQLPNRVVGYFADAGCDNCGGGAQSVMVGEGIAPLTATPERSVTVSRYSALQHKGCCHQHRLPCRRAAR